MLLVRRLWCPPPSIVISESPKVTPDPVDQGELPWWHGLTPGIYRRGDRLLVLAVGRSMEHHHSAEGLLKSKVSARLSVRRASEPITFQSDMPEPELSDLFITRKQQFLALYQLSIPQNAGVPEIARPLPIPEKLHIRGIHRLGRHIFEGDRHLFLECDVEGPVTNPNWGQSRASARH